MQGIYDLILRNASIIDPSNGTCTKSDIAFLNGKIDAIGNTLSNGTAHEEIDVLGAIVTPGLIDLHTHIYHGVLHTDAHADSTCLSNGVTTAVDGGSAGWMTFAGFRDYVIPTYKTRVYSFLNICSIGLTAVRVVPELQEIRFAQVEHAAHVAKENPDLIVGIKVRIGGSATGVGNEENAREALRRARHAADLAGITLMVHVSASAIPLAEIFDHLNAGDILSHVFDDRNSKQVFEPNGQVRGEVFDAAARGVVLDVGHASVHCNNILARQAIAQGLVPTTISTDMHAPPPGRILYNLPGLMSTFLAIGMPLHEVLSSVTCRPAAVIGKSKEIGSLNVGMRGDAAVFEFEKGDFEFIDGLGNKIKANQRFRTRYVIREGKLLPIVPAAADFV